MERMWRSFFIILLWIPLLACAEDVRFSYGIEQFYWEEFDHADGHSLLVESGLRHVMGISGERALSPTWRTGALVRFYTADIDYDGETQKHVPAYATTEYRGWNIEVDVNRVLSSQGGGEIDDTWLLALALGYDRWSRNILDGKTIYGNPTAGYLEEYGVSYIRIGTEYTRGNEWLLTGGVKYPFQIEERVGYSRFGYDDPTLHPKGALSLYGSVGYSFTPRWSLDIRYDSYRFNRSDIESLSIDGVSVDGEYVAQPRSYQDSVMLMLSFKY